MTHYNSEFATHDGRCDFINALNGLSPESAAALVRDKAWSHDYDWMQSALDSNFLRNTLEQSSGNCPFNEVANSRFTAFAAVLCSGVYGRHVGDGAGQYLTSLIDEEKFGGVMEILVNRLSIAVPDRTTEKLEFIDTCSVLMCCAVAIGRIDLMEDINHLCSNSSGNHFVNKKLIGIAQYDLTEVSPAAFAVAYSKPEALTWLCENGWMRTGPVALRHGYSFGSEAMSLVEFTHEVENPEMLPAVLEVIKNSNGVWSVDDEKAVFKIAHQFLENANDKKIGISKSGRYFSALSKAGVFSNNEKTSDLIRNAVENGCVTELKCMQAYLDATAMFHDFTPCPYLHFISVDDRLSTATRMAMLELFLPSLIDDDSQSPVKKIDIRDTEGNTALASAIIAGQSEFVQVLLEHGADHTLDDRFNEQGFAELRAANDASGASINVLLAWRAKEAMQNVLSATMQARSVNSRLSVSQ
jgi:hypothetical protein